MVAQQPFPYDSESVFSPLASLSQDWLKICFGDLHSVLVLPLPCPGLLFSTAFMCALEVKGFQDYFSCFSNLSSKTFRYTGFWQSISIRNHGPSLQTSLVPSFKFLSLLTYLEILITRRMLLKEIN